MNERLDLSHALDHARQLWPVNASSGPFCKIKSTGSSNILWLFLIKEFLPLALAGYGDDPTRGIPHARVE